MDLEKYRTVQCQHRVESKQGWERYNAYDESMRCGAYAISGLSLMLVAMGLEGILILWALFNVARLMVSLGRTRFLGALILMGSLLWISTGISGFFMFSNYLYSFNDLIDSGPDLPKDKSDKAACKNLLLNSHPHDLMRDYVFPFMQPSPALS